jgi:HAD superfamily hydrolase (TIGR01549 family)
MIRWVFLDVGNVLFNDDPLMVFVYEAIFEEIRRFHPAISFPALMAERERLIHSGRYWHYSVLVRRYLDREDWDRLHQRIQADLERQYNSLNLIIPGITQALTELHASYHLGIAANQMRACRPLLAERGLLPFFSRVLISEELGLSKPDPRFFQRMIAETSTSPEEIVMVGDRIDNDIAPARGAGMHTLWLRMDPCSKGYQPTARRPREYLDSLCRASISTAPPTQPGEEPDFIIQSPAEILPAIQSLHL